MSHTNRRRPQVPCPHCSHLFSRVHRTNPDPQGIKRERVCLACSKRFITVERLWGTDNDVTRLVTDVISLIRERESSPLSRENLVRQHTEES